MIIKNNKVQVIFISCFASIALILLISFAYFLGFEKTIVSLLLYMISILVVIMASLLVIVLFTRCCNSYTKISADKIIVYKNDKILKEVDAKVIKYCEYSSIWNQLLSDPKGGYYRVFYEEDNKDECLFISLSKKQVQQVTKILKKPYRII